MASRRIASRPPKLTKPTRRPCPKRVPIAAGRSSRHASINSIRSRSHGGPFSGSSTSNGCCPQCQRRIQGRHPLQTSDALGAAAAQLGPDAQAAIVDFNKQAGMSHGKISRVFKTLFGISITRGGSVHVVLRAAGRAEPVYQEICTTVKAAPWVVPDETGWHVGGAKAWLHALVGPDATAYVIDPTRSGAVADRIIGSDY